MPRPDGAAEAVSRLHAALAPIERAAKGQAWDAERPWRRRSHVWTEAGALVVDLHDLKAAAARRAVEATCDVAPDLDVGAVIFIVGRGRHSIGQGVLPTVVGSALRELCAAHPGWTARPLAGRWALVLDPRRAPAELTGRLGWLFWLGVLAFIVLAIWAVFFGPG